MRKIESKIGQVVGKFRYLRCLSDSESTKGGANPIYAAECTSCGHERKILYRNRNAQCPVCRTERRRVKGKDRVKSFGDFHTKMLAIHPIKGLGRLVEGEHPIDCFEKLAESEAVECHLYILEDTGAIRRTFKEVFTAEKKRTVADILFDLGMPPLKELVPTPSETEEVEETPTISTKDAPPI